METTQERIAAATKAEWYTQSIKRFEKKQSRGLAIDVCARLLAELEGASDEGTADADEARREACDEVLRPLIDLGQLNNSGTDADWGARYDEQMSALVAEARERLERHGAPSNQDLRDDHGVFIPYNADPKRRTPPKAAARGATSGIDAQWGGLGLAEGGWWSPVPAVFYEAVPHLELTTGQVAIVLYLVHCGAGRDEAFPSATTIGEAVGLGRNAVCRALEDLKEKGLLNINRRRKPGGHYGTSTYDLTPLNRKLAAMREAGTIGRKRAASEATEDEPTDPPRFAVVEGGRAAL